MYNISVEGKNMFHKIDIKILERYKNIVRECTVYLKFSCVNLHGLLYKV